MRHTLPAALAGITNHIGQMLRCVCGPDATYRLLLMQVYYRDGRWWLAGYDEGELGEPLILDAADVSEWVVVPAG